MKVLVTGGTGFLGGAIVRALQRRGHEPIVFARRAATVDAGVRCIAGDVTDADALTAAARGVDAICHAAALVRVWTADSRDFDRVNVGGLERAIAVCERLGIGRLVYTSSFLALPPAARDRPLSANPYQRSKERALAVARRAAAAGAPIVTMLPGVVFGPGARTAGNLVGGLVRDHLSGRLPGIVGPERVWSLSYTDDVSDAHVTAIERGRTGAEYGVGGANVDQMTIFRALRNQTGKSLPRRIPAWAALAAGWIDERLARPSRPPRITPGTVRILQHDWPVDSRRSVDELSYRITALEAAFPGTFDDLR